ncbi:MAG TPA: hypothetical protein VFB73_08025 [Chloroflexota bacterium]|nr:hypothetical protein [Chloroflexota bacterium]
MGEERRPMDATRRLLKIFGVKVTDYEARTQALLDRAAAQPAKDELPLLLAEAAELTADLDHWLSQIQAHVLARQQAVLEALAKAARD